MEFKYRAIDNINPSTTPPCSLPMDDGFPGFRPPLAAGNAALGGEPISRPFPNPNSKPIHYSNQQGLPPRSLNSFASPSGATANQVIGSYPPPRPPLLYSHRGVVGGVNSDNLSNTLHLTRPLSHVQFPYLAATTPPPTEEHFKGSSRSMVSNVNGYKDASARKNRDDALTVVRDRKVRITEDASLYALCRSWLRNGLNDEGQPTQHKGATPALPKPSPATMMDTCTLNNKKDDENDKDEQEEDENVEHLSTQDLLKGHIKRAKRVRAHLREERLQRIARYRSRLRLLVPLPTSTV